MTEIEALNFTYIAIFVNQDAKVIMEKLANLFERANILDVSLKFDIHQVLKKMIKYHFKEDVDKLRELLLMITKKLTYQEFQALSSYDKTVYERDVMEQQLTDSEKRNQEKDSRILDLTNQVRDKDKIIYDLKRKLNSLE